MSGKQEAKKREAEARHQAFIDEVIELGEKYDIDWMHIFTTVRITTNTENLYEYHSLGFVKVPPEEETIRKFAMATVRGMTDGGTVSRQFAAGLCLELMDVFNTEFEAEMADPSTKH